MANTTQKKAPAKKAAPAAVKAAAPVETTATTTVRRRRVVVGTVVSNKMQKTIVVKIDRRVRHELYGKYVTKSRKFKVHDESNTANVGDLVSVVESRPLSREKRFALQKIIRRAGQAPEANV
jgi:small subunit ribosomal protein S17